MITAAEAFLLNPKSQILSDELRQIEFAIEDATKEGKYFINWEYLPEKCRINDICYLLGRFGYRTYKNTDNTIIIYW